MEEEKRSKVLIIGGTGKLGYFLAQSSLKFLHPTYVLVRDTAFTHPVKVRKLQYLSGAGATLLKGSLEDEKSLAEAVKQVDVVICAISSKQVLDQKLLIRVIKEAGCIKRFIPSEFGADPDKTQISDMDYNFYSRKAEIRRLVEAEGIPYTYISCNFFMSYLLPSLVQPGLTTPPRDKVTVFGDGNVKGVFVKEQDVAAFTICAVDDPQTLNKVLYLRPPGNVCSMNELADIWESKIGKKLERIYIREAEILARITVGTGTGSKSGTPGESKFKPNKSIKKTPYPDNMQMIFIYSVFVKGDHTNFDIEISGGVDGIALYPQLKYTTISEYLETLL